MAEINKEAIMGLVSKSGINPLEVLSLVGKLKSVIPSVKDLIPTVKAWEATEVKPTGMIDAEGNPVSASVIYAAALNEDQKNAFIYVFEVTPLPEDITLSNGLVIKKGTAIITNTLKRIDADEAMNSVTKFLPGV